MRLRLYDLLGVKPEASHEEIRRAYRRLALKLHPDRGGDSKAFQELAHAYEVLSNEERRAAYDRFGDEGPLDALSPSPRRHPAEDIFDILGSRGGGAFAEFGFGRSKPTQVQVSVTLEEAYFGTSRRLRILRTVSCSSCQGQGASVLCTACQGSGFSIHRRAGPGFLQQVQVTCPQCRGRGFVGQPCSQCHGSGTRQETQELSVAIPPGVRDGHLLPLYSLDGRRLNDMLCLVTVKRHARFERSGDDLHLAVEVSLSDALLEEAIRLQHLDGRDITVRPDKVPKPHSLHILQGEGMPKVGSQERGNLHLHFKVTFPEKLDEKTAKELIAALQKHLDGASKVQAKSRL